MATDRRIHTTSGEPAQKCIEVAPVERHLYPAGIVSTFSSDIAYSRSPAASRASSLFRNACSRTHRPLLIVKTKANRSSLHRDLARRTGSGDLGNGDHLVPGVDQLHRDDVVAGQGLLVFLVDQPDGLVAAVGSQQQRFEHHVGSRTRPGHRGHHGCARRIPPGQAPRSPATSPTQYLRSGSNVGPALLLSRESNRSHQHPGRAGQVPGVL